MEQHLEKNWFLFVLKRMAGRNISVPSGHMTFIQSRINATLYKRHVPTGNIYDVGLTSMHRHGIASTLL